MHYTNQKQFSHLRYNHNMANGGPPEGRNTVATSGCGLCSLCNVVNLLTVKHLFVEDCVRLSEENGANLGRGTNMRILAPIIADMYNIDYKGTTELNEVITHLQNGGQAIAHMGNGVFCERGHFINLISYADGEFCVLDPGYSPEKFQRDDRKDKVHINEPFVYCNAELLHSETRERPIKYYLFNRKR